MATGCSLAGTRAVMCIAELSAAFETGIQMCTSV